MHRILRLWFGLTEPASRGTYLFHGALLMGIKYSADNALVHAVTGVRWTPWDFQPVLLAGLSLPDTRARAFKSNSTAGGGTRMHPAPSAKVYMGS